GVDVSHHQGDVDWPRLAGAGVQFAYIKASEGTAFKDSRYTDNWIAARRAGVIPGAYHFYSLCAPPELQAKNFLASAPPTSSPTLPPAVDLEFGGNCSQRPSTQAFQSDLRQFLEIVETAWGRPAVLYATPEFYPEFLEGQFANNPLWVRSVFGRPRVAGFGRWRLWQYANRGRL